VAAEREAVAEFGGMRVYWGASSDPSDWADDRMLSIERCAMPRSYEAADRMFKRHAQRVGAAWKRKRA
jgi:hypothetical protein